VHVDLSQELISDWTYQKFHDVATWVFEKHGHFGRIDVALDDRNGVIDVDRIYAAVKAGRLADGFIAAVEACGAVLEAHCPRPKPDNPASRTT